MASAESPEWRERLVWPVKRWSEIAPAEICCFSIVEFDAVNLRVDWIGSFRTCVVRQYFDDHALTAVVRVVVGICRVRNVDPDSVTRLY